MPDDTLKQRAEKFRAMFSPENPLITKQPLIAEVKWARANPAIENYELSDSPIAPRLIDEIELFRTGWQSFADHLLDCLGEK